MFNFSALIAAIAFYLIPIGFGKLLVYLGQQFLRKKHMEVEDNLSETKKVPSLDGALSMYLGRDFSLGAVVLYLLLVVTSLVSTKSELANILVIFSYTSLILSLGFITAKLILSLGKKAHRYINNLPLEQANLWSKAFALIYCFALAVISQTIWKWKSGIQYSLDWDTFFHQMVINNILRGNFSFVLSQITDSVIINAYSSIFHATLAIPQAIFKPNILAFWWYAGFLQLLLITFSSFNLGGSLYKYFKAADKTNDKDHTLYTQRSYLVGAIAAMFGAFSFLSYLAYNPYFLIPQILSATVAVNGLVILLYQLKYRDYSKNLWLFLLPVLVFIVLNHYILGIYCATLIIGILVANWLNHKFSKQNVSSTYRYISLLILALIPFVLRFLNLEDLNPNESSYYMLDLKEKFNQFTLFYGYLWLALLPIGIGSLLFQKKSAPANILVSLFIIIVATLIAPIPYNLKFLAFGSFLIHSYMALGVVVILEFFGKGTKVNVAQIATWITLGAALIYNLTNNVILYKQTPSYKDKYSHVSRSEADASAFVKEKYARYDKEKLMLVSDPATMFVFEALADVNTPGGAYTPFEIRKLLTDIYYTRDTTAIKENLLSIQDKRAGQADTILLVLSHRYFEWAQGDEDKVNAYYYNVWQPIDLKVGDYDYLEFLKSNAGMEVVYMDEGVFVFEVKR